MATYKWFSPLLGNFLLTNSSYGNLWSDTPSFLSLRDRINAMMHWRNKKTAVDPKGNREIFYMFCNFFTARKRSLRQGNIFTPVCHSVHGGVPGPGRGCLLLGVSALGRRRVCSGEGGGVCSRGCLLRGVPGGDPPDGYCCGRYASYWNAFLFFFLLPPCKVEQLCLKMPWGKYVVWWMNWIFLEKYLHLPCLPTSLSVLTVRWRSLFVQSLLRKWKALRTTGTSTIINQRIFYISFHSNSSSRI